MLLLRDKMLKKIQNEDNRQKIKKVIQFAKEIATNRNGLRNSLYILKLKNCRQPIYKFRLNSGERVLFMYASDVKDIREEFKNAIILLDYCKHDKQELIGKNITKIEVVPILDDNRNEESIDKEINQIYKNYHYYVEDEINVVISDEMMNDLIENNLDEYLYYLNDEQYGCLKSSKTTIVKGSAGSGKTTVLLHKLGAIKDDNLTVAYFTYTENLKKRAKSIYNKFFKRKDITVKFSDILSFLAIDSNHISFDRLVTFDRFKVWYENKLKGKFRFDPFSVWAEIRGVIKGCMGINWLRNNKISADMLNESAKAVLLKEGFITKVNNLLKINEKFSFVDIKNELYRLGYKNHNVIDEIAKLEKYFYFSMANVDSFSNMLEEEYYLNLPSDYSIFSKNERNKMYQIACAYNEWLKLEKLYDENDLAILLIEKIKNNQIEKFDCILIDEIQDLTELECFALFNLVKDKRNIFVTGDVHQIINPTFFSFGRIANYFCCIGLTYNEFVLRKNYRSQQKIVSLANKMYELRKRYIGAMADDILETSVREGEKPFLIPATEENIEKIAEFISLSVSSAIIVSDNRTRDEIARKYNIEEKVFTVQEAKGLEFDFVVCFNLVSPYEDIWEEIFKGKARHNSRFRYYFNLFYVGITRAKKSLVLLENRIDTKLFKEIGDYICIEEKFEAEIVTINPNEKYKEAMKLEQQGLFEKAMVAFKKLGLEKDYLRCKIKFEANLTGYEKAGDRLVEIFEYEDAIDYYKKALSFCKMLKAELLLGKYEKNIDEFEKALETYNVSIPELIQVLNWTELNNFFDRYINMKKEKIMKTVKYISELLDCMLS